MAHALDSLALFVAAAPNAMAMFDRELRFIAASRRFMADLGLKQPLTDLSLYEAFPEISDNWKAVHRRCLAGAVESVEVERFESPKGGAQWIRWEVRPWMESEGRIGGIVISADDITARVEAQQAKEDLNRRLASAVERNEDTARRAQEAERLLKDALDVIPGGFAIYDVNDRLVVFNKAIRAMYPLRDDEVLPGARFEDLLRISLDRGVFGDAVTDRESWVRARMDLHCNPVGSIEQRTDDGRWLRIEERRTPDGGTVVIRNDITTLENRKQELVQKTALLEATLHNMGEGIAVFGADRRLLLSNELAAELLRAPSALLEPGAAFEDVIRFRAARGDYGEGHAETFASERLAQFNSRKSWSFPSGVGDGRVIETRFNPLPDGGGIFVFRDVTERESADARIREEEAKFRSLVEQNVAGTVIVREDGTIGYCNGCFASMIGCAPAEIAGHALLDFVPDSERPIVIRSLNSQLFETGQSVQIASSVRARDGSVVEVLVNASRSTFEGRAASIAVVVDVSAKNTAERALVSAAAILAAVHESSPDGILVVDPAARILSVNRRFGEILNIPTEVLAAGDESPSLAMALNLVDDPKAFQRRVRYLCEHPEESGHDEVALKDGRVIDRLTSPLKGPDGESLGRIWFFRDISERRRNEDALRASEERFRMVIEEAPDAILLYDFDHGRFIAANKAAERLFGVPWDEILRHGPQHFYPSRQPDARPVSESFAEHNRRVLAGEEVTYERRIRRASGEERVCRVTLVHLPSKVSLIRASFMDITEQRAAEHELSEVLRSTVKRQEAERQRIARELHDSLGQYLAAMTMKLEILAQKVAEVAPLRAGLVDLKSLTAAVGDEVSRLAWELRPIALDDIGLEPAVRRFVEEWAQRSGMLFDLHVVLKEPRLPPDVETTLYRVLQEGITNVVKHANAKRVGVTLTASLKDVVMIIEDDGVGFEPEDLRRSSSSRLGLRGIRERLASIYGGLEIESQPGNGTALIIRVTLNDHATAS